jgi:hypothetical protein
MKAKRENTKESTIISLRITKTQDKGLKVTLEPTMKSRLSITEIGIVKDIQ